MNTLESDAAAECLRQNGLRLLDALAQVGITKASVRYAGQRGSGAIRRIRASPASALGKWDEVAVQLDLSSLKPVGEGAEWPPPWQDVPLSVALIAFTLAWVTAEHPCWQQQDGSSGRLIVDVASRRLRLKHDAYFTENFEHSLMV